MTLYTVHAPAGGGRSAETADAVAFVKDGFSWPALVLPIVWLPWRRMWWPLLGFLAGTLLIGASGRWIGEGPAAILGVLFSLWFALEANAMRRWTLGRRGFSTVAVVEGASRDAAERRFFDAWLGGAAVTDGAPPRPATAGFAGVSRSNPAGVIGLFPGEDRR